MVNPELIAAPAQLPLTLIEVKAHLKYDLPDEDGLIMAYMRAAVERCEDYTRRCFITRSYRLYLDCWLDRIRLPHPPLIAVASVDYDDVDAAVQTLDPAVYEVQIREEPGFIQRAPNQSWPSLDASRVLNRIRVTYDAGTGPDLAQVPDWAKQGMLYLTAHFFYERTPLGSTSTTQLPFTVDALWFPNRLHTV